MRINLFFCFLFFTIFSFGKEDREIIKQIGGEPVLREGFTTDNGNIILDVHNLDIMEPTKIEQILNNITGVVTNGLFAIKPANVLLLGTQDGVKTIT